MESVDDQSLRLQSSPDQRFHNEQVSRYTAHNQQHVFGHYDSLSSEEKSSLDSTLSKIDLTALDDLFTTVMSTPPVNPSDTSFRPFTGSTSSSYPNPATDTTASIIAKHRSIGLKAIRENKVACVLLSGGQGTRLGFDGPKGAFDIGLPSGKCLFEIMIEKSRKLVELAHEADDEVVGEGGEEISPKTKSQITWYIMTSPLNHSQHLEIFKSNDYFGLPPSSVVFFQQGVLPCLTTDGKIIMTSKSEVAVAPDGNGGIYPALISSGSLEDMKARGVEYLHIFAVDNVLVKVADPIFVGYCVDLGVSVGNKVLWKRDASEKVGVVVEDTNTQRPQVIEYSDMDATMKELKDEKGRLVYGAGNICNHFLTVEFLDTVIRKNLKQIFHVAKKKIPYLSPCGGFTVKPEEVNGVKLESFIFDVFPMAGSGGKGEKGENGMAVLEVLRAHEFSPIKNSNSPSASLADPTPDSPLAALKMYSELCSFWCKEAGVEVDRWEKDGIVEIGGMLSYGGEGIMQIEGGE